MSEYDNGFARAQASYDNMSDDRYSKDPEEDEEYEETDSMYEIDKAEEAFKRIKGNWANDNNGPIMPSRGE
jgi:hypothetical protein